MLNFLRKLNRLFQPVNRLRIFMNTPNLFCEHWMYALRRALIDKIVLPMYVSSKENTRFYLSNDKVDDAIVQEIVQYPELYFPKIDSMVQKDHVILDIGGHHGLYACEALRMYPNRELIILEPHPGWCKIIEKNIRANNGLYRTRIVNACLASDRKGRTLTFDPDSSWGASTQKNAKGCQEIIVNSLTIKDILENKIPALIFCNAEGAEFTLVSQLKEFNIKPPVLVIMMHGEYGNIEKLRTDLRNMGYLELNKSQSSDRPNYHYIRNYTVEI